MLTKVSGFILIFALLWFATVLIIYAADKYVYGKADFSDIAAKTLIIFIAILMFVGLFALGIWMIKGKGW